MIEIELYYKNKTLRLSALIDTRADYTIFSRGIAEKLGIDLENGEMKVLEGAGGNLIAYKHQIKLKICDKEIEIIACFSEKEDIPENILGRKEIINNFKLVFDKNHFELVSN